MFRRALLALALLLSVSAQAEMARSLLRSDEALAMGGAYTAVATGPDAVFYNPACVAGIDSFSVHYATLDAKASDWVVTGWSTLSALKNPNGTTINQLMGQDIYTQATYTGAVLAPGFALVPLYDMQGALYAKNQALPKILYGYQTTGGVQAAFGFSSQDGRRRGHGRKNTEMMNEWRFGIGGKYLVRTGGYRLLSAAELFSLNSTNAKDLIGGKGSGYGADLGIQRIQRLTPELSFSWGLAYLNVGDVQFGGGASPLLGDLSTGIGFTYKRGVMKYTLAYDIQQLNQADDFRKKQNLGLHASFPTLDLYTGLHQGFFTYGAAFDMWILRVSAYVYKEELGSYVKQDPQSLMAIRLDLKFGM